MSKSKQFGFEWEEALDKGFTPPKKGKQKTLADVCKKTVVVENKFPLRSRMVLPEGYVPSFARKGSKV